MIGQPHLRLLQELGQPQSPSELAEKLEYSLKHVSEVLSELEELGLIKSKEQGRHKLYNTTEVNAVGEYRKLTTRHPNIDFPELLTPSSLHVIYHLDKRRSADTLTKLSKPSRATVYRVLKKLRNRGILTQEDSKYVVRKPYEPLSEFAQELAMLKHVSKVKKTFPSGKVHVVWDNDYENISLLKSEVEVKNQMDNLRPDEARKYYLTGLNEIQNWGLRFMTTPGSYLFYTEEEREEDQQQSTLHELSQEDLVCHMTLIHKRMDKPVGQRYTLLYLAKVQDDINREDLRERAIHYGILSEVNNLLSYIEEEGVKKAEVDLPTWVEFKGLAKEYEVDI
jgi:DNA-binding transcriptional regulator GbsR (MarR family)